MTRRRASAGAPLRVLTLLDYYLPGYKGGGPLRTVQGMVEQMGDELHFRILTRDRDVGEPEPYPGVAGRRWVPVGKAEVGYLAPAQLDVRGLRRAIAAADADVLYLNSLFSPRLTFLPLLLRRVRAVPVRPVVLAPRGELHPGALGGGGWGGWVPRSIARRVGSPRRWKKEAYLALCRGLGLFDGVVWQASSEDERGEILRHLGRRAEVVVAPNLALPPAAPEAGPVRAKLAGTLRVAFLSRITPKKNLETAIALLEGLRGRVELEIYGPAEDAAYWARCQAAIARLPSNVVVRHHGGVTHDRVPEVLRASDAFLFPTLGENYGHVIREALVHGCPVVVSDRTPWRGLEAEGAGWDLPLERPEAFRAVLQRLVDMDEAEYRPWSRRAEKLGRQRSTDAEALRRNHELFARAAAGARRR